MLWACKPSGARNSPITTTLKQTRPVITMDNTQVRCLGLSRYTVEVGTHGSWRRGVCGGSVGGRIRCSLVSLAGGATSAGRGVGDSAVVASRVVVGDGLLSPSRWWVGRFAEMGGNMAALRV